MDREPRRAGSMSRRTLSWQVLVLLALVALGTLTWQFRARRLPLLGDALLYYAVTVSVLWDGDLELRNQYDTPLGTSTVSDASYFIDRETGKAFTLFNPGTGLMMVPAIAASRVFAALRGRAPGAPFDDYHQRWAAYTTVILTVWSLVILWSMLGRWLPPLVAVVLPVVFLFGTNWFFYTVVFVGWAHVPAIFWTTVLMWAAVRRLERRDLWSAFALGVAGGALFTTRNLGAVAFLAIAVAVAVVEFRRRGDGRSGHDGHATRLSAAALALVLAGFLVCAAPQLRLFTIQHGSPIRTSVAASVDALKTNNFPGGAPGPTPYVLPSGVGPFEPVSIGNLAYLPTNLFNLDNGLFVCHPLLLVGLLGGIVCRPPRAEQRALIVALGAATYVLWFVDAAYFDTWFHRAAGSGFGERRFLDLMPFFLLGTALLWEGSRPHRWPRRLLAFAIAVTSAYGVTYFLDFMFRGEALLYARSSLIDLVAFVLLDWRTVAITAIVLVTLLAGQGESGTPGTVLPPAPDHRLRNAAVAALLLVVPVLVFHPSATWERQRLQERRGFFFLWGPVPYVRIWSGEWGPSSSEGREMLRSPAAIALPAPLEPGDVLLLRLQPASDAAAARTLEVYLGDDVLGRTPLRSEDHVYTFPVERAFSRPKELSLALTPLVAQTTRRPLLRVVDGRVLLRGTDDAPFGEVHRPEDGTLTLSGPEQFEGWALDDRGLVKVFAEVDGQPVGAAADFADVSWPDIPMRFTLYPGLMKNWWTIRFDPAQFASSKGRTMHVLVIAEDTAGRRTTIGTRTLAVPSP